MPSFTTEGAKDFFTFLDNADLLDWGSVIPKDIVHDVLDIDFPASAPKKVYDDIALYELAMIDYVRTQLLKSGKYIKGTNSGYRILLPSENEAQCKSYISQAKKKLNRSLKLSKNTPATSKAEFSDLVVRANAIKDGIKD